MIQPEDDFQTWMLIACSTVEEPDQFVYFISDIERLITNIIQTGSLPPPIQNDTDNFIDRLCGEIEMKILSLTRINEFFLYQFQSLFFSIIRFGKYGTMIGNEKIVKCSYVLIKNCNAPIYTINENTFCAASVANYSFQIGFYHQVCEELNKGPHNLSSLALYFYIIEELYIYDDNFDMINFSSLCAKAALKIARVKPRLNTKLMYNIFTQITKDIIQDEDISAEDFCEPWLELFVFFIKSGIFDKELFSFQQIQSLLNEPKLCEGVIAFFSNQENLSVFNDLKTIHPELCIFLAEILTKLAEFDFISTELLSNLWKLHAVQHLSDQSKFFAIFSSISTTLSIENLSNIVFQFVSPEDQNEEWVKFLGQLAEKVGQRDETGTVFATIRDKLLEIALSEGPLQMSAQNVLPKIIKYHLNKAAFEKIYTQLCQHRKCVFLYSLLSNALYSQHFDVSLEESNTNNSSDNKNNITNGNNRNYIAEDLMDKTIGLLGEFDSDKDLDVVISFIGSLCYNNLLVLTNEQLNVLFKYRYYANFENFISRLILRDLVPIEYLTSIIKNLKPDDINVCIFKLIRSIVCFYNEFRPQKKFTSLPLKHEQLLWEMSLIESKERQNFAIFLCNLYSSNDGSELTDYVMMTTFIQKWNQLFDTSDKNAAIALLRTFINEIENKVDIEAYNIHRHSTEINQKLVHVKINGSSLSSDISFDLPENTLIFALKHKISKITMTSMNSFLFTRYNQTVDAKLSLRQVAGKADKIKLVIYYLDKNKQSQTRYTRDVVPSQLITKSSDTVNMLLSLLKEDNLEAKLLLNYLPTNIDTLIHIEEMKKCASFDYSAFLPINYPNLFLYNFESLIEKFDDSIKTHFLRTGGFSYLIEAIPNPKLSSKIISFLKKELSNQIKMELAQSIFDFLIPYIAQIHDDVEHFLIIVDFLIFIFKLPNLKIKLMNNFAESVMKPLLFSKYDIIRCQVPNLFENLNIPLFMFLEMIDFLTTETAATFYKAVLPHVHEKNEILITKIKEGILEQNDAYIPLLEILKRMLEESLITEEEDKLLFTNLLINLYLHPDSRDKEKHSFGLAVNILSKLQNAVLLDHLINLHAGREQYNDWNIDGDSNIVSPNGHCGLVNYGAICFLNSTLQQFFAIPLLRNYVLEYKGNDKFLEQLRMLFAEMYLSQGQLQNPENLVEVWTGWDGEPMDPMVQQDALEFTQMLIDKLVSGLTHQVIYSLFGGTTIDKFEGVSEKYESQSEEQFTSFTLPIQGSSNVDEALSKIQNPNFFTGENQYFAESLNKKIDAKKYAILGQLPQTLILQLPRFEYNFQHGVRTKINTIFHFPTILDLAPYTIPNINQMKKYILRGVVMHRGSADFGHYTSYIKDRISEKWYLYNDCNVVEVTETEVIENGSGLRGKNSSAYILFYDRIDTIEEQANINNPMLPSSLVNEIRIEMLKKDEYRLFCSESYFNFMKLLAESRNPPFVNIALHYYFDTFPFTLHIKRAFEIVPLICEQLKTSHELQQNFIDILDKGPFSCSLVYCPTVRVRNGAFNMIRSIDINLISTIFFDRVVVLIEKILPFYQVFDQCFLLLDYLFTSSQKIHNHAIENKKLLNSLIQLVTVQIPQFISNDSGDNNNNSNNNNECSTFYNDVKFNGLFMLISRFKVPKNFVKYILDETFIRNVLNSKTSVQALTMLLKSFDDQDLVHSFLLNLAEKSGVYIHYFRITFLLFQYFGIDAFLIIPRCRFFIESRPSNSFDLALTICNLVFTNQSEFRSFFLENANVWIFKMLTDELLDCRLASEKAVSFLIPDISFEDISCIPHHEYLDDLGNMDLVIKERDQIMIENAEKIFLILISQKSEFIELVKAKRDGFIGLQYIDVIDKLSEITSHDISSELIEIAESIIPNKKLYDCHLSRLYTALKRYKDKSNISKDFLFNFFPAELKVPKNLPTALKFFKAMDEAVEKFPFSFIESFLKLFAFTEDSTITAQYKILSSYLVCFSQTSPDDVYRILKENLDRFASVYLSGVLMLLEALPNQTAGKRKLPLLNYLWSSWNKKQVYSLNDRVVKAFELSEGPVDDLMPIISLLNSNGILDDGRKCIWQLIFDMKPPFSHFADVYKWKGGDWENLARFIIIEKSDSATQWAIEAAQNSLAAFSILFDFLVEKDKNSILEDSFSQAVLTHEINENFDVLIKYINLFSENGKNEDLEEKLIMPIARILNRRAKFFAGVVENPIDGALSGNDIIIIYGEIKVVLSFDAGKRLCGESIQNLKNCIDKENVSEKLNLPEINKLRNLLNQS